MQTSLLRIFERFFGCRHRTLSRVFTIRKRTYQVCVGCGREFEYSWELMCSRRRAIADNISTTVTTVRAVRTSRI